jgi:hypothetical protein
MVKSTIIKSAAHLLDTGWISDDAEDLPKRTPKTVIRAIAADRERRRLIAIALRGAYDELNKQTGGGCEC